VIKACFKVFDDCFEMFYKQDEKALYPPQLNRPDYGRGFYYCGSCGKSYFMADRCPSCGTKKRKVGKKGRNSGYKPRVSLDFGDGE